VLRGGGEQDLLSQAIPTPRPDVQAQALRRTKRFLHGGDWLFVVAMLFTCFAFGRIVADTSWDVSPVNFLVTAAIAWAFWIAFFTRLVLVRKKVYRDRK